MKPNTSISPKGSQPLKTRRFSDASESHNGQLPSVFDEMTKPKQNNSTRFPVLEPRPHSKIKFNFNQRMTISVV